MHIAKLVEPAERITVVTNLAGWLGSRIIKLIIESLRSFPKFADLIKQAELQNITNNTFEVILIERLTFKPSESIRWILLLRAKFPYQAVS
jgi:hypothetical protein